MKSAGKFYKWEVLGLLWMAYLLNQADRQVFNTVLPAIRDALNLTDTSIGLIATIFNLCYAFMVPLGGLAGDRLSRKWVVTIAILFWSVATMFTGLATGVVMLILLRSVATGGVRPSSDRPTTLSLDSIIQIHVPVQCQSIRQHIMSELFSQDGLPDTSLTDSAGNIRSSSSVL